ncbi:MULTISPECIES: hypothetical protein [Nostocales]|uniref:Uncharacterized protein n=3 Tax=Nostocales TaxID=1161 RepID=A0A8S9SZ65_9CYAN|nr:hypothetical protein [Tolypothrix bouteillei]KAF3885148.1 hypothetical protein DA73_0400006475 [Tolypothrix bouteillei VB521301]
MSQNDDKILQNFTEISLDISHIETKYYICKLPKTQILVGLIVFIGTYLAGSSGSDDALFIKWRINEFCDIELPEKISGLVVDFRNLDYQWGDDLDVQPQRLRRLGKPVRVVVTAERYEVFKGVLDEQELRTNIETAFAEVKEALISPQSQK